MPPLIDEPVTAIVADVSFISLTLALPARACAGRAWRLARGSGQAAIRGGPEAIGKGGIVRDAAEREKAVARCRHFIDGRRAGRSSARSLSPILGRGGNEEFLIGACHEA